jgi:nascent polypeptide-associated complex subunit alpha
MPEIKEVPAVDVESDSDVPELEEVAGKNISRSEMKARKALAKLGLKHIPEVNRVVIRRANNALFVIAQPDVYKNASGETHVVFGQCKIEDLAAQQAAAQKLMQAAPQSEQNPTANSAVEDDDDEVEDETGLEANDIEMIMSQANVSRAKAVRVLRVVVDNLGQ